MSVETRIIVLSPNSRLTPSYVARFVHLLNLPLTIKETCYGIAIEGERRHILKAVEKVRSLDPGRIYTKPRGFPIADKRRCRADHGSRPGFCQLEDEFKLLPVIEGNGPVLSEEGVKLKKERPHLDIKILEKIIDEVVVE